MLSGRILERPETLGLRISTAQRIPCKTRHNVLHRLCAYTAPPSPSSKAPTCGPTYQSSPHAEGHTSLNKTLALTSLGMQGLAARQEPKRRTCGNTGGTAWLEIVAGCGAMTCYPMGNMMLSMAGRGSRFNKWGH